MIQFDTVHIITAKMLCTPLLKPKIIILQNFNILLVYLHKQQALGITVSDALVCSHAIKLPSIPATPSCSFHRRYKLMNKL
jgi:hypothetical protein